MKYLLLRVLVLACALGAASPVDAASGDKPARHEKLELSQTLPAGKRLASPFSEFAAGSASSTEIVTRAAFETRGARNVPEALSRMPGVVLSDITGNGEEPALDFRGFNEGESVVVMLDGVRLNEAKSNNVNWPFLPLGLIEQLEISRGGVSALYGEGATGGVVNAVSRSPQKEGYTAKISSLAGSFGEWMESFEASSKTGNQGVFMAGDIGHRKGFRRNTSAEKGTFYGKYQIEPDDESLLSVSFLTAEAELDRSGSIRESILRNDGRKATERPHNAADLETNLGIVDYKRFVGDNAAISANAFYRQTQELTVANFATFDTFDNEQDLATDHWGGAVQADLWRPLNDELDAGFILGADYNDYSLDQESYNRSKATEQRLDPTVNSESDKDDKGFFAKVWLTLREKMGAYYGFRYDDIGYSNADVITPSANASSAFSKSSHSVGASYRMSPELTFSGSFSKAFKSPSLSDLFADPSFGGNSNLKPEETDQYEAGAKWEKGAVKAAFTTFIIYGKNEIGFDPNLIDGAHPFGQSTNFGKTKRYGTETSLATDVTPWLTLEAGHSYTEALFKSNEPFTEKSGDHIPLVPRNRFTAGVLVKPVQDLKVYVGMVSVPTTQVLANDLTNDRNGRRLPPYTVFDANVTYTWQEWDFSFRVKNLLDEDYETAGSLGGGSVTDNFFTPEPGRAYYGSVSRRF